MSTLSTVDSPDAAASLGRQLHEFDPVTRSRGAQYHRTGRVSQLCRTDASTVTAAVAGRVPYRVALVRDGDRWSGNCTCPMAKDCKHTVAVALAWQAELGRLAGGAATPSAALPPEKPTFRQHWEPILVEKNGRPLSPEESTFLGKLAQVFHHLQQAGRVGSSDLARLGFATPEARRGVYQTAFEGWWSTPPRDPMELWQYVAYDIETAGLTVPEFLRPVTDTAPIRTRLTDRHRHAAVLRWTDRFDQLGTAAAAPAANEASPAEWLDLRLCLGTTKWLLESRATAEAPWKTAPRMLLERFTREQAGLAALDASPAVFAFLALCQSQWRFGFALQLSPDNVGSRQFLHRVLTHPVARRVVTGPNGAPLSQEPQPLRWHLTRSESDPRDFIVALHRADGTPLPAAALFLPGAPGLYLHDGVIYRGPPALDGQSVAGAIVPAEVIESPTTLQTLRRFGARLPEDIAARFVAVPLRPRFQCTLDVDFAGQELFLLQLLAVADTPPVERSWSPSGWLGDDSVDVPQPASSSGPQQIYSLDSTPATAAVEHLGPLALVYNPHLARWTRRFTRNFPEEFLAWRQALPPAIEVVATGELASLLEGPVRARIDLELIETKAHRDWFDLALALKPEDTTLTHAEVALLLKARGKLVRLAGKGWRRLSVEIDAAPAAALAAAGFETASIAEAALAGERHRFHALQLAQTAVADLLPERQAEALRSRARAIVAPTPPALPAGLRAELRPYQREGFAFLAFLSANGLGGVLADDMGLGKTVQTLAWLLWLAENLPAGEVLRTLVVCPKSVVGNWEAEAAKFSPSIATVRYSPDAPADPRATAGPHIIIANYTQLRLNAGYFMKPPWHAVILDEGQFIKTPSSKVAHVARELPGQHRLILTGTPIENRLLDLWSLFAFALPGLLGTQASFKRHYAMDNPLALAQLRTRVRHFLLRRTKSQVATDLPARTEEDIVVELEGEQAKLYQAELKRARAQLLKVETVRQLDRARFNILASLMRLRQICCHPALIGAAHRDAPSAKLDELLERLEELRDEGHQVLVFSQFVTMLELIREKLVAANIEHLMLTGQTEDRDALVRQFQAEKRHTVFLLSLKAAGFGLNLTAASYVILYDPWWNPAVEAQAIDRTHRIGQSQPVIAYRLIARGTVEEKIRALQHEKAALAGAIVQEESLASVLDLDSLRQILA